MIKENNHQILKLMHPYPKFSHNFRGTTPSSPYKLHGTNPY
jgi:hypothetical protein